MNIWRSISSAPHGPPTMGVAGVVCWGGDWVPDGEEDAGADEAADEDGAPPDGDGELCELASTATPALVPAMTITAAAAIAGAQARPRRRGRCSRPNQDSRPSRGSLTRRYATCSTVTGRGGSGVMRCSTSASCRSSVFTTPPLRS